MVEVSEYWEFYHSLPEPIARLDPNLGYEWTTVEVYRHPENGGVYVAAASGCSCNTMADDIRSWESMRRITRMQEFLDACDATLYAEKPKPSEVFEEAAKVQRALDDSRIAH